MIRRTNALSLNIAGPRRGRGRMVALRPYGLAPGAPSRLGALS